MRRIRKQTEQTEAKGERYLGAEKTIKGSRNISPLSLFTLDKGCE